MRPAASRSAAARKRGARHERAALAIPVAVAVLAGVLPAWLAARADPVESVRPPVLGARRGHMPGGITALALVNVLRTPGRDRHRRGYLVAAATIAAGTLVTAGAALLPVQALRRLPAAHLLAEE